MKHRELSLPRQVRRLKPDSGNLNAPDALKSIIWPWSGARRIMHCLSITNWIQTSGLKPEFSQRRTRTRPGIPKYGPSRRWGTRAGPWFGRGARHQIRAHLGFAGFPLVNDAVYGDKDATPGQGFMLHHYRLRMPEFTVTALPDWDDELRKLIEAGRDRL